MFPAWKKSRCNVKNCTWRIAISAHLAILLSVASIRCTGILRLAADEVKCSSVQLLPK